MWGMGEDATVSFYKLLEIIFEIKPEPVKFPRLSKQDEKVKTAALLS